MKKTFSKIVCTGAIIGLLVGISQGGTNKSAYYHNLKKHYHNEEEYYDNLKDHAKAAGNYKDYMKYKKLKHKYKALKEAAKFKEKGGCQN